eukprot:comp6985_c0_seq1/m.2719 comp6985_c0_seq1/g.2719  ORF comp6985_c0_seq1/g.2719 comp6985_c0_seq1/m.2719 type:complete len:206 (-) comp6985_c0_seq1:120-737(-)
MSVSRTSRLPQLVPSIAAGQYWRPTRSTSVCSPCKSHQRPFFTAVNQLLTNSQTKTFSTKKLFRHPPSDVYAVVSDVNHYCEFVPWVKRSKVLSKNGNNMTAELTVGFPPLSESYISEVEVVPNKLVRAKSHNTNLFRHLSNEWRFLEGPKLHGSQQQTCLVDFYVSFDFASPLHMAIANQFFDAITIDMIAAYEKRCAHLYGIR